jgi:hypothetical protein
VFDIILDMNQTDVGSIRLTRDVSRIFDVFLNETLCTLGDITLTTVRESLVEGIEYFGILKRWSGSEWVKAKLKCWINDSWIDVTLRYWDGMDWLIVDTTGT